MSVRVLRMVAHKSGEEEGGQGSPGWSRVGTGPPPPYRSGLPGGCTHGSRRGPTLSWVHLVSPAPRSCSSKLLGVKEETPWAQGPPAAWVRLPGEATLPRVVTVDRGS